MLLGPSVWTGSLTAVLRSWVTDCILGTKTFVEETGTLHTLLTASLNPSHPGNTHEFDLTRRRTLVTETNPTLCFLFGDCDAGEKVCWTKGKKTGFESHWPIPNYSILIWEMGFQIFQRMVVSYEIIYGKVLCKPYIRVITIFYNHYICAIDNDDKIVADISWALFRYQALHEVLYTAFASLCAVVNNNTS